MMHIAVGADIDKAIIDGLRKELRHPIMFDGHNFFDSSEMAENRFQYHSMGRPSVEPKRPIAMAQIRSTIQR